MSLHHYSERHDIAGGWDVRHYAADVKNRSGFGIQARAGWAVVDKAGHVVRSGLASREEAEERAAFDQQARAKAAAERAEKAAAEEAAKAQAKAAEARYARVGDQWAVAVPAHVYQDGAAVVVVKRSGERKSVVVGAEIERRGDMVIAAIVEPARQQAAGPAAEAYRIGAGYGVDGQIWDNA